MSTHENDELGELLTQELHRRTDGLHGTPLGFDDVRGKATSIRRRRRVATVLAAAAAVAVIVPTAILATNGPKADGPPIATQTPSVTTPSASPTSTPTMGADPHALDVSDLPTGAPPAAHVLGDKDIALAQTSEAEVRMTKDGTISVEAARPDVRSVHQPRTASSATRPATAVAWATDDGQVMAWADGETEPFVLSETGLGDVRRGRGHRVPTAPGRRTSARSSSPATTPTPTRLRSSPSPAPALRGEVDPYGRLLSVRDATDDGRVLGLTEIDELAPSSCSAVLHRLRRARHPCGGPASTLSTRSPRTATTCSPATPSTTASATA